MLTSTAALVLFCASLATATEHMRPRRAPIPHRLGKRDANTPVCYPTVYANMDIYAVEGPEYSSWVPRPGSMGEAFAHVDLVRSWEPLESCPLLRPSIHYSFPTTEKARSSGDSFLPQETWRRTGRSP